MATGQLSRVLYFLPEGVTLRLHPWSRSTRTPTGQEELFTNGERPVLEILFCLWNLVTDQLLVHAVARIVHRKTSWSILWGLDLEASSLASTCNTMEFACFNSSAPIKHCDPHQDHITGSQRPVCRDYRHFARVVGHDAA